MKSLLFVFGLCAAFLAVSTGIPGQVKNGLLIPADSKQCAVSEKGNGTAPALKKTKAAKLPRWHRLIPGMFR